MNTPDDAALDGNVGGQWPGVRRPQAAACNDKQRQQCPLGLCNRLRSGVTHKVSVLVAFGAVPCRG